MLAEYTCEELGRGLDAVAADAIVTAGLWQPPVDAFAVAGALGIVVAIDERQATRARYVRLGGRALRPQPAILLRPDDRPERCQWAVAHEIGEHLAQRVFAELRIDSREAAPTTREAVANQLAGRLLLPSCWFWAECRACEWDLFGLKARFASASHELIARRMLEGPQPLIVTLFDQGRQSFRRSNVYGGRVPQPSPLEIGCWRQVAASMRPQQAESEAIAVHGWPVYEPHWRREILVTRLFDSELTD